MKSQLSKIILTSFILLSVVYSATAQNQDVKPQILILDVSEDDFNQKAEDAGWSTGHLMFRESNVTSSSDNFWNEVQVYSKDGAPLFSTSQQVKTRAILNGSLQLANYDRNKGEISPLIEFQLSSDDISVEAPDNSQIVLNMNKDEFGSFARDNKWSTFHIMLSASGVTSVNNYQSVQIISSDGHILMYVAYPAADFIRSQGKMTLANYSNKNVSKLQSIPIK